ncbi:methyltransferase family protein [Pseudoduganella sp. UC29_71]|uniref:methyltransferase family protein n=1 Tax=Pseudoduganella sp. UC29_71 TaxID=3350174 RepID=UPI00366D956E
MKTTTSTLRTLRTSRLLHAAGALLLASVWIMFCYSHLLAWQHDGEFSYLLFAASESLVAMLFLLRDRPAAVSDAPLDWLLALAGTATPMLFTPVGSGLLPAGAALIAAGVVLQIAGLLSLNRSFGLVAARRTVKTGGLYRVVRHPLYASYLLMYAGYLLVNTSLANGLLVLLGVALLMARIVREERFLARDVQYLGYMDRVKYRLIPLLF